MTPLDRAKEYLSAEGKIYSPRELREIIEGLVEEVEVLFGLLNTVRLTVPADALNENLQFNIRRALARVKEFK